MENSLHHLLMTNHTAFRKRIFSALKNEGLTSGQPKVLEYLAEHDGAMQKDIAAACRIEPATMTSLLCGMEKKGLITRLAPDRRSLSVYLTEKGRMLIPLIKEEFSRIEDRATSVANVLSCTKGGFSLGVWLIIWNCVLILGQIIILRKKFQLIQLLQIPLSFLFGYFTDFGLWLVGFIPAESYIMRLVMVIVGIVILGFGVSLSVSANVIMNSGEAFVKAIADTAM